jgi:hypothetical protein
MRALDENLDGLLDSKDAAFAQLLVWVDGDADGLTDGGELRSLADLGITSLSLDAEATSQFDNGNFIGLMGSYTTADGQSHQLADVWFAYDSQGNRTFDLGAIYSGKSIGNISLSGGGHDVVNVSLEDVLVATEGQNGIHQLVIDGDANDAVHLVDSDSGTWTAAGTVESGGDTYMVYVNNNAQLLINDKLNTVFQ